MLTENQKNYLLDSFFKNNEYPGWRNIGTKLLETGKCIVPGERCIWRGGIGNHIEVEDAKIAVGCLMYTFNLVQFKTTAWYKEIHKASLARLKEEADEINKKLAEVSAL